MNFAPDDGTTAAYIDKTRLNDARETVRFMCSRVQSDGFLLPPEALFCETTGYQAEAAATMALAGLKLDMPEAFESAPDSFRHIRSTDDHINTRGNTEDRRSPARPSARRPSRQTRER